MTTATTTGAPILELRDASKRYGGSLALESASIAVTAGEVHCLLGDNGAGKSTLIKLLSGVVAPTSGGILVDGQPVTFADPREAQAAGIATVHQDVGAIPLMSVARNFFLGQEPLVGWGPLRRLDRKTMNHVSLEQVHRMGITRVADPNQLVGTLSGGERQALAIARAMYFGARVLILDEPTSALGVKEASFVLSQVDEARKRGLGVVFITHNATHAIGVGDTFTVLIHGQVASTFRRGEKSREEILDLMAGGESFQRTAMEVEDE